MPHVSLRQLTDVIAAGPALVSFLTDTVPALATRPEQAALIYAAKGRPPSKPLILMGASLADLLPYVAGDEAERQAWQAVTRQHWPGQLTLVLPASERVPAALNPAGTGTLGIRVPNHPVALEVLTHTGPLATTSANFSGQPPITEMAEIALAFPTALTLLEPAPGSEVAQPASSGQPSTVAQWCPEGAGGDMPGSQPGSPWKILRQGAIRL
ncbi:MAG: L-threonylcarbamoyladenylate synthase [Cyanobacteria bacterium J06635_11]